MCRRSLVSVGSAELGAHAFDVRRRHAYWCPAGCRGPESDGTFEFFECPACGSCDTVSLPLCDGMEELECSTCGTITSVQILPWTP
jgi:LSD1 subclass zinc finger protein